MCVSCFGGRDDLLLCGVGTGIADIIGDSSAEEEDLCETIEMLRRIVSVAIFFTLMSSIEIVPLIVSYSRLMRLAIVDLPLPVCPTSPMWSPGFICIVTFLSIGRLGA